MKNENKIPPFNALAKLSKLKLTEDQILFLDEVTDFNLEARYPEHNKEFNNNYLVKIQKFTKWLRSQLIY